jgi:hypothetical protein
MALGLWAEGLQAGAALGNGNASFDLQLLIAIATGHLKVFSTFLLSFKSIKFMQATEVLPAPRLDHVLRISDGWAPTLM